MPVPTYFLTDLSFDSSGFLVDGDFTVPRAEVGNQLAGGASPDPIFDIWNSKCQQLKSAFNDKKTRKQLIIGEVLRKRRETDVNEEIHARVMHCFVEVSSAKEEEAIKKLMEGDPADVVGNPVLIYPLHDAPLGSASCNSIKDLVSQFNGEGRGRLWTTLT